MTSDTIFNAVSSGAMGCKEPSQPAQALFMLLLNGEDDLTIEKLATAAVEANLMSMGIHDDMSYMMEAGVVETVIEPMYKAAMVACKEAQRSNTTSRPRNLSTLIRVYA